MAGFFITISNGLLKDGHRKRMGSAVWEFMWCIDKITRIDENGDGWVLGGRTLTNAFIAGETGIHEDTVSINLIKLEKHHYLRKILHSNGYALVIHRAKKRFGKNTER